MAVVWTAGLPRATTQPLITPARSFAPITSTLRAAFATDELAGLHPGVLVDDPAGWIEATALVDGARVPELLDAAKRSWRAAPHAAAALAWKAYTYWITLPVVLGWASARRVPLVRPGEVLIRFEDRRPLLTVGLRPSVAMAVLPSDPLAALGGPGIEVVHDEDDLLARMRGTLLDGHLSPLLERIQGSVRLGRRTLLGSVASGIAYGVLRAADVLPGSAPETVHRLLTALDLTNLVDLVAVPFGTFDVRRRTCCLAFTLPEPKICAGCCIRLTTS